MSPKLNGDSSLSVSQPLCRVVWERMLQTCGVFTIASLSSLVLADALPNYTSNTASSCTARNCCLSLMSVNLWTSDSFESSRCTECLHGCDSRSVWVLLPTLEGSREVKVVQSRICLSFRWKSWCRVMLMILGTLTAQREKPVSSTIQ